MNPSCTQSLKPVLIATHDWKPPLSRSGIYHLFDACLVENQKVGSIDGGLKSRMLVHLDIFPVRFFQSNDHLTNSLRKVFLKQTVISTVAIVFLEKFGCQGEMIDGASRGAIAMTLLALISGVNSYSESLFGHLSPSDRWGKEVAKVWWSCALAHHSILAFDKMNSLSELSGLLIGVTLTQAVISRLYRQVRLESKSLSHAQITSTSIQNDVQVFDRSNVTFAVSIGAIAYSVFAYHSLQGFSLSSKFAVTGLFGAVGALAIAATGVIGPKQDFSQKVKV